MTSAHTSLLHAERRLEELLNEFFKAYFNGQPHQSPTGDLTFLDCDRLFNQIDVPTPQAKPQIHTVFTHWRTETRWWNGGVIGTWESTLYVSASGVRYGHTVSGFIEETVHGKVIRTLHGMDIRWQVVGPDLLEQVFYNVDWVTQRTFPGATAIRWIRASTALGADYLEQVNIAGTWTTQRTLTPDDPTWDGTTQLVTHFVELSFFLRVKFAGGDLRESDFRCREVAGDLNNLLRDTDAIKDLNRKGVTKIAHRSGPRALQTSGYSTRLLVFTAQLITALPKEGQ